MSSLAQNRIWSIGLILGLLVLLLPLGTGQSGVGSQYKLNSVTLGQNGPNNQVENVVHGATYCVGTATTGLVLKTANPVVFIGGAYALKDVNMTGIYVNMQMQIVNVSISNTFTQGNCGSIRGSVIAGSQYFATLNQYLFITAVSSIKLANTLAGDTVYLGFAIVLQGAVNVQFRTGSILGSPSAIFMQEQV
jgi:hypothetical protein